jgi:STE24 endopeptidase
MTTISSSPQAASSPEATARAYARIRYRLLLAELALGWIFLAVVQWSGASQALERWWVSWTTSEPLVIAGYLAVFGAAYTLLLLPLRCYGSFVLERRFGLSRLTLARWCVREAKQLALSAVLGLLMIEGLYAALRLAPGTWPVWATAGWVMVTVVLARVFPTLILPIFYQTAPVRDEPLLRRLLDLCRRVGLPALGVFRVELGRETRKANAALAGLGASRRVLLADTLLEQFPAEEIEGVLAHELAHHRFQHIQKMLLVSALGSWAALTLTDLVGERWAMALGLTGLADIAGLPMLLLWLSVLGLIGLPLQQALSRQFEWQADRFAVEATGQPTAFADALRRLAQLNLADPSPPRWIVWLFYDHPPVTDRIRAADQAHGAANTSASLTGP